MGKKRLLLSIITPERAIFLDRQVDSVTIPAFNGEMGILPGHAPFVVELKEGVMRYNDGPCRETFAVMGGFAEIHCDKILILAEAAELSQEINEERARQAYCKAKESLAVRSPAIDLDEAFAALRRALARLKAIEHRTKSK